MTHATHRCAVLSSHHLPIPHLAVPGQPPTTTTTTTTTTPQITETGFKTLQNKNKPLPSRRTALRLRRVATLVPVLGSFHMWWRVWRRSLLSSIYASYLRRHGITAGCLCVCVCVCVCVWIGMGMCLCWCLCWCVGVLMSVSVSVYQEEKGKRKPTTSPYDVTMPTSYDICYNDFLLPNVFFLYLHVFPYSFPTSFPFPSIILNSAVSSPRFSPLD
jgi:hypothetical protein